jgi:ElaB/YqjD/DUF883 family membrane-anchored ribosome-binding protein
MFNSSLPEQASQSAERAIENTQRVAHEALDKVRETSAHLRDSAQHASETGVNFIRHEPVKSVLIAAATGAALMALIGLLNRPHARS